jgi:hypothetical protein
MPALLQLLVHLVEQGDWLAVVTVVRAKHQHQRHRGYHAAMSCSGACAGEITGQTIHTSAGAVI